MEEKLYQVKDIMQMYGISRDTIKYYEKQGFIEPSRNDNGYRVFDIFNVEKMKKILDLRDLGFSVKEVAEMLKDEQVERSGKALLNLRIRTEEEIQTLYKKMEKIRIYERSFYDNKRFVNGFNVEYNFEFCLDCPMIEETDKCSYFVREADVLSINIEGEIVDKRKSSIILNNCDLQERCGKCGKTSEKVARAYRGMILYENEEQTKNVIRKNYTDVQKAGYQLKGVVYVIRKILKRGGQERLFLDIRIPVEE